MPCAASTGAVLSSKCSSFVGVARGRRKASLSEFKMLEIGREPLFDFALNVCPLNRDFDRSEGGRTEPCSVTLQVPVLMPQVCSLK